MEWVNICIRGGVATLSTQQAAAAAGEGGAGCVYVFAAQPGSSMELQLFRDRWCMFTPNGRPRRKPNKIVEHISVIQNHTDEWNPFHCKPKHHHISSKDCSSSRPPLSKESLSTPTPCTYNVIGMVNTIHGTVRYCKKYFDKQDLLKQPTPCTYNIPRTIGVVSQSMKNSPSFTIRHRGDSSRKGAEPEIMEHFTNQTKDGQFKIKSNKRAGCYPLGQTKLYLIGTRIENGGKLYNRGKLC